MQGNLIKSTILLIIFSFLSFAQGNENLVKTFPASPGENLQINTDPGNIDIETWDKNEVKIEVVSRKKYEVENLVAEKSGNTIKFYLEVDDSWNNNITIKVKAPKKFNYDLESTGGNINVGSDINGYLKAETEGGNINFANIIGEVNAETNGGNINGENVEANVKLHTNGGNISLGNIKKGKAEVDTYGGNISVGSVSSDLSAKTHGGSISVGDVGGNADVFTYGGHISIDKVSGSASMETYGGHLNLDGASGNVKAITLGGHINLENITGSIEASTKGGHVTAELDPKPNTTSSLETSGGHMSLSIPSSAKATIEVFIENDDIEDEDPNEILKSDFPAKTFDVNKNAGEIKATYILNGGGSKISMNCVGGNVKIEKWNK
ncbi:MAG: hypothetical protein KDC88_12630 [Ignavibacteriae bacterium]|nr:hypothetical protein [Ignavibacteriota bacterium]MCB9258232.1 hypothetical protein [Ignavibacteriales bacterium]